MEIFAGVELSEVRRRIAKMTILIIKWQSIHKRNIR